MKDFTLEITDNRSEPSFWQARLGGNKFHLFFKSLSREKRYIFCFGFETFKKFIFPEKVASTYGLHQSIDKTISFPLVPFLFSETNPLCVCNQLQSRLYFASQLTQSGFFINFSQKTWKTN
jgi:hypothetical protein